MKVLPRLVPSEIGEEICSVPVSGVLVATFGIPYLLDISPWSLPSPPHGWLPLCLPLCSSSVQSLSRVRLFVTPWIAARQASLSIINSWSSPKLSALSQWCHPAISSSVIPFSSYSQSLPASGSFPVSQLFAWGGQSTGVSASESFQWTPRTDLL